MFLRIRQFIRNKINGLKLFLWTSLARLLIMPLLNGGRLTANESEQLETIRLINHIGYMLNMFDNEQRVPIRRIVVADQNIQRPVYTVTNLEREYLDRINSQ